MSLPLRTNPNGGTHNAHAVAPHSSQDEGPGAQALEPQNIPGVNTQMPIPGTTGRTHRPTQNKKRANINIATLNVNGASAPTANLNLMDKWSRINSTLRRNKLAVLAIQETHLDDENAENIRTCFGKAFTLLHSADPTNPKTIAGVAFIINKALVNPNGIKLHILVPGRAIMIQLRWPDENLLSIINIYAPVKKHEQPEFWASVEIERREKHLPHPDFLLGDFNLTEDAIDRAPPKFDNHQAADTLRGIRLAWGIQDQWRHAHPNEKQYSYRYVKDGKTRLSRLDRIYSARKHAQTIFDWKTEPSPVPTDHWMVSLKFAPKDSPLIGNGRWTWYLPSLNEKTLLDNIIKEGIDLQTKLERIHEGTTPRNETNPQSLWEIFKADIRTIAKTKADKSRHKTASRIKRLEKDRQEICNDPEFEYDDEARSKESYLASEIKHLKVAEEKGNKEDMRAKLMHHGEKLGGIWSAINKEKKPRDMIRRLKIPNMDPPQYERSTTKMTELARLYHQNLQSDTTHPPSNNQRSRQIDCALDAIPREQTLQNPERTRMDNPIDEESVAQALTLTKNNTATGLDGCPYELWKTLTQRYEQDVRAGKNGFDIIKTLTLVFQDIQTYGLNNNSNFATGWMCPLYKKKDPTEISNYRPITLLNTDYKLLTKALAIQLRDQIENMVHPDQAGFIRNRSIFNQIRLANAIIDYAEMTQENGTIVALDQEKAYDKIKHDYLWAVLEKFKIPRTFIETVKTLYENAHTTIAINGILSKPYKVTRGVRQGDPLSCALFDLAIEPLACRLRSDPRLQGLNIPGTENKLITSLFADDTNIYLSENDRMDDVQSILKEWCIASGAKFNIEKTEVIPIGTPEHRAQVITSRKINPQDRERFIDQIRIAADGEAIRSLGAWIGNKTNEMTPWEPIIDKAHKNLETWNKSHPTLFGRKLIIQMIIGGYTQFLTMAQGMPNHIESTLIRMIRNFMWSDSSTPKIAMETLYRPIEEGGLNLLDLNARNEAIEIMWLKTYLTTPAARPTWTKITDILIDAAAPKETIKRARTNTFLQTWKPNVNKTCTNRLNRDIIRMVKASKKYGLTFSAIKLSPRLKEQMPAWYHPGSEKHHTKNRTAKCMIGTHNVTAIADLIRMSKRLRNPYIPRPHTASAWCICPDCVSDRIKGCKNPHECATESRNKLNALFPKFNPLTTDTTHGDLSLTPMRKRNNQQARHQNELVTFDPSITNKDNLTDCLRIFTDPNTTSKYPAQRGIDPGTNIRHPTIKAYTDGACLDNGKMNARCGSGVWFAPEDPQNQAIRVPGQEQSNQVGELVAVIRTAQITPPFVPLEIHSDSQYVIEGLTTNLPRWEDIGWIEIQNASLYKAAAYLLRRRSATTKFKWVKGHSGNLGNDESDQLAKEGAQKDAPDNIDLQTPAEFNVQGAKLSAMTQALAYKGIRQKKKLNSSPIVPDLLQTIRTAIQNFTGKHETNATIWKSFRKAIIRTRVQQFLYKVMHQALMVGDVWNHIPNYEFRETCPTCVTTESMEHILTQCTANANQIIWSLAEQTWPHHDIPWPEINFGLILGVGCLNTQTDNDPENNAPTTAARKGKTRLLQILISESTHLIWVLRCERIIHEDAHSEEEIKARWTRKINDRLTGDRIAATKIIRNQTHTNLVKNTWRETLRKQHDLPVDWIHNREVLVGSGR